MKTKEELIEDFQIEEMEERLEMLQWSIPF